jgi:HEAT repeat protein
MSSEGEPAMPDNSYRTIRALLASKRPEEIQEGLKLIAIEITKLGSSESRPLFEMVTTLFYIDALDHPELVPVLDQAVKLAATFGAWVIPMLIEDLDAGDIKSQWAIAHVLGRIGAAAIDPMLKAYAVANDPTRCAFILYALGKIKSEEIVKAAPTALKGARSSDLELRDTAVRALGKFVECIPPAGLSPSLREDFVQCLQDNLSDPNASVRSKAMRSLGKMGKHGHLTDSERGRLRTVCKRILGVDEQGEWDRAFVVRKETEETLAYL